ncbi:molybdenum cofactor guanylyltransferase [Brevundimonas sp.]|uniref:molybdenum cofactor guanylyltransferase n=1 Tax=Brevundimonas sp. TaxID=1871086 RepID=UPI001A2C434A|nr:molybdenum cofactor guanylyltransferase [Brevundimonas sp.]MBJ7486355.1 molybdenum cofactor guanylyltransferase [Brevundimonas sp.]
MMVGLVLCGGRSSRFGSEKAVAPVGDGVMMDRPLAALRPICLSLAVSARPASGAEAHANDLGIACLQDNPKSAEGPLAGIWKGLEWAAECGATWLAVAPCDAITVTSRHYDGLQRALVGDAVAVVATSRSGLEPLVSIWPVSSGLAAVVGALADGGHPSIRSVLDCLGAVRVPLDDYDGANVNFRRDLRQASPVTRDDPSICHEAQWRGC